MQAVIMAGGKGTRLRAITNDEIPKPMVPIAGKPILQWQIETLRRSGVTDILLITGYLGEKIEAFSGTASLSASTSAITVRNSPSAPPVRWRRSPTGWRRTSF